MEKKRIVVYQDLNEPHQQQVRMYARMTPEERWEEYLKMRKMYFELGGVQPILSYKIHVSKPSWM